MKEEEKEERRRKRRKNKMSTASVCVKGSPVCR